MKNNKSREEAIVLASGPNGLGAIRGLWTEGVVINVIARSSDDISLHSSLPKKKLFLKESGISLDNELLDILNDFDSGVLIPTSDAFVSFLQKHQEDLNHKFKISIPPSNISELLIDKAKETQLISKVVPVPKTIQKLPETARELSNALDFPIIIKPRSFEHFKYLKRKNVLVYNYEQLIKLYKEIEGNLDSVIAQKVIPGDDDCQWVCNCTFDNDSNLIGAFTFNRLNLTPAHFGVTSYAISEENEQVMNLVKKIGKHLAYKGPAMVEFKFDQKTNEYMYIEINPRLGMCNYYDTRCGINNVYYTYLLAIDKRVEPNSHRQKNGVVFVSLFEDIYSRLKNSENLGSIFKIYLKHLARPHVYIYFSIHDPKPFLFMTLIQTNKVLRSCLVKIIPPVVRSFFVLN